MFTDDLVDTSVPGEGTKGNSSGVKRDGMIYHCESSLWLGVGFGGGADVGLASVQIVKDIIARSPGRGKRDREMVSVGGDGGGGECRDDLEEYMCVC